MSYLVGLMKAVGISNHSLGRFLPYILIYLEKKIYFSNGDLSSRYTESRNLVDSCQYCGGTSYYFLDSVCSR